MARASGGRYLAAAKGEALLRELRSAVFGTPEGFTVYDKDNRAVARGPFGSSATLAEGKYRLETSFSGQGFAAEFWINTEATTAVIFDAAKLRAPPAGAAPAAVEREASAPAKPAAPAGSPPARFCTGCGAKLASGARFCGDCGRKVQ
jgi:hypothetical protein